MSYFSLLFPHQPPTVALDLHSVFPLCPSLSQHGVGELAQGASSVEKAICMSGRGPRKCVPGKTPFYPIRFYLGSRPALPHLEISYLPAAMLEMTSK